MTTSAVLPPFTPAFCAPCPRKPDSLRALKAGVCCTSRVRRRTRVRRSQAGCYALREIPPPSEASGASEGNSLFLDEEQVAFWDSLDTQSTFGPLTEEEKARLRDKLPSRLAEFLIRRAEEAEQIRDTKESDDSFFGRLLKDLPPDVVESPEDEDDEFKDYVYDTPAGPPSYRRRGSSLFGGGDGLPDVEDVSAKVELVEGEVVPRKGVWSLFLGNPNSVDEQASKVGYGILALVVAFIAFKIVAAFVSFFVSFTFSFFAIFALSAGIFFVIFLLRF